MDANVVPNDTHLTLSRQTPKEFVGFEFGLLVGDNAWHFEDESW